MGPMMTNVANWAGCLFLLSLSPMVLWANATAKYIYEYRYFVDSSERVNTCTAWHTSDID